MSWVAFSRFQCVLDSHVAKLSVLNVISYSVFHNDIQITNKIFFDCIASLPVHSGAQIMTSTPNRSGERPAKRHKYVKPDCNHYTYTDSKQTRLHQQPPHNFSRPRGEEVRRPQSDAMPKILLLRPHLRQGLERKPREPRTTP
jgi:hypothetical protein